MKGSIDGRGLMASCSTNAKKQYLDPNRYKQL